MVTTREVYQQQMCKMNPVSIHHAINKIIKALRMPYFALCNKATATAFFVPWRADFSWVSVYGLFESVSINIVHVRSILLQWIPWLSLLDMFSSAISVWTGLLSDHVLQRTPTVLQTLMGVEFSGPDPQQNPVAHSVGI